MKNIVESILKHPIATVFIITATAHCVSNIIGVAKGKDITPMVSVTASKKA